MKWKASFRKLTALLLSVVLMLSLCTTAFATEGGDASNPDNCTQDENCPASTHDAECPKHNTEDNGKECEHNWGEGTVTQPATCTEPGKLTYTCSECATTKEETIPATGHTKDEVTVSKEATCTEDGNITYTCSACGAEMTENIPAAHTWNDGEATQQPTCTNSGTTTYTCFVCGETKTEEIPVTEHQYGAPEWKKDENSENLTATFTCSVCSDEQNLTAQANNDGVFSVSFNGNEYTYDSNEGISIADVVYVAKIGETSYGTLQDAFTNAQNGDTVMLIDNITEMKTTDIATVPSGKNITLDLNSKSITVASDFEGRPIVNNGTLIITGNGTIDSTNAGETGYGAVNNYGTLTIENGTFRGNVLGNGSALYVRSGSTAVINGGSFEGTRAVANDGKLTINDGTFKTTSCNQIKNSAGEALFAYCIVSSNELYFNNGSVTGVQGGLAINSGYAEVKNGTFKTTGCEHSSTGQYSFYALYIAGEVGQVEAHISGGTYTSVSRAAILCGNDNTGGDGGINAKATAYITGGTFIGGGTGEALKAGTNTGDPTITGGTYSSDVSAYVPDGYAATGENGNYIVGKATEQKDEHVAVVEGQYFKTLETAIDAAKDGGTVTLLKDTTDSVTIPEESTVTLDLNGKTITTTDKTVNNLGTLTVKDSSEPSTGKLISTGSYCIVAGSNSTTTFASGTIESVEGAIITGMSTGATINITGGTLNASDNAVVAGNGTNRDGDPNTINISGGTLNGAITTSGYVACGVYAPWKDNVNITGGTINVTGGAGVVARAGNVKISGGTITTTGDTTGKVGDSRVVVPCSAIVYDSEANYPAMTDDSKIAVTGGTFNSDNGVNAITNVGTDVKIEISGGSFSSEVAKEYCADGFYPNKNADGTYSVHVHNYGEPVFTWTDNNTCTVTTTCETCGDTLKETCTVTKETIAATATEAEKTVYTATATINGKTVTDTKTINGLAILAGQDQSYALYSGDTITIRCSGALGDFVSVSVDGEAVDFSNYTVKSGSTVLTFSNSYLNTLFVGEHTVTMNYKEGVYTANSVSTTLTVTAGWEKLAIEVKANRTSVRPGKTITYTLTVTNNTGTDLTDIVVSNTVDKNLTFSSSSGSGTYTAKDGLWTIPELKAGKTAKITVKYTVKSGVKDGTNLVYASAITSAEAANGETLPDNVSPSGSVTVKVSNKISLIPGTGDTSNIGLWITVLAVVFVALVAVGIIAIIKTRKKK